MTRRKSRNKTNSGKMAGGVGAMVLVCLSLLLIIYFLLTGEDPAGLFEEGSEIEQVSVNRPARIGSGGNWWHVYFTDPGEVTGSSDLTGTIPEVLIDYIDQAQDSISIAAFEFDLQPVAEALLTASDRGVEIRWMTDDEHGLEVDEEGLNLFASLEDGGIEVRSDGRQDLMHNKFLVFDRKTVWTGSTNLTENGNFRNNNNVLIVDSPELARMFEREFEEMWNDQFGARAPSNISQQSLVVQGTPIQALFAPEDRVISALIPLAESAKESIHFMAFSFTDDELGKAILERAEAGVNVQGIFERRGSQTEYSELSRFYCSGISARQDGNPRLMHHKVLIIDDQIVITGSANFSDSADRSNDENVLIVANEDIAQAYLQEFDRLWLEASAPVDLDC